MSLSIDFFLRILNLSFFHPSFALMFFLFIYVIQGYGVDHPVFLWSGIYAATVCFSWLLSYLGVKSRNGWRSSRIKWEEEVVVITGGSGGLGSLLAETLAVMNVTVAILDIKPPEVENVNIVFYECDVSKFESVQDVANKIIEDMGHPTILINNAGIVKGKTILDESEAEIIETINTNLLSFFWTTKVFLPEMIKNKHGHIVTVSSVTGFSGIAQLADYSASKAALIAFHEALRYELDSRYDAKAVRTTLVCPGEIKTGMFDGIKVKFPFITPPLAPLDVAKPIITALEKGQSQDILVPYYVNIVPALRFLPSFVHDLAHQILGADFGMRTWKGKSTTSKKNQ